jgi:hypothetical protein
MCKRDLIIRGDGPNEDIHGAAQTANILIALDVFGYASAWDVMPLHCGMCFPFSPSCRKKCSVMQFVRSH